MNKVVLHISTGDETVHKKLIVQLDNIKKGLPECTIEVVVHADAIYMLLADTSKITKQIRRRRNRHMKFLVCNNSLVGVNRPSIDLIKGVEVINSALIHLVQRQQQHWAYIKMG